MGFYQSAKEEIKRAADVVELIGQFVQLKKAGRNYVGRCPFHADDDPSFNVSPERQTFHCFGCKKGGDIFSFWMEYHGITFLEALRDLADRYQVPIEEAGSGGEERRKSNTRKALFKVNEEAALYFQESLGDRVKGKVAREYLERRSISKEIASRFRIGYAPEQWEGLSSFLKARKIPSENAVEAGLIVPRKSGGYYDRFRGRIMFPIFDMREQIVGFGGRVLNDSMPKYMNTPETSIFHKAASLYGLNDSYRAIREKNRAVIVEGYMDCLALKKHGLEEVVATLGTALTENHVRKLKGYAREVVVLFDSDEAGKAAAMKSLPIFLNEGLAAKAAILPDGHDPDSFVNEKGSDRLVELLAEAPAMFDFFVEYKLSREASDVEGKVRALDEIFPVLASLKSDVQCSLYIGLIAERIGVKEDKILAEFDKWKKNPRIAREDCASGENSTASEGGKNALKEAQLLNLMVNYPHTVNDLMDCECKVLVMNPAVMEIVEAIFAKYSQQNDFSPEDIMDDLRSESARQRLREAIHRPSFIFSEEEVDQAVSEIRRDIYRKRISTSLDKAKRDPEELNRLLALKRQQFSEEPK